jgi:tRNA A-37 threonylcarbamoyl transferase component Bud32
VRFHRKGGLGEVHLAQDEELHREVALKKLQAQHAANAESRRRFLLEAEITARLEHPGIVPVHGLVQDEHGLPCYAMRFIQGESLKEAIERFYGSPPADPGVRRLQFRQLLVRFVEICNAVAYAHSRGILHRDIKPANIMLGKFGETLLVDWGLAKPFERDEEARATGEETLAPATDSGEAHTVTGDVVGTPAYMSPEQAAGRLTDVGPSSDIYSLGATLYSILTGKAAFPRTGVKLVLDQVQRGEFPPPRKVNSEVTPALEAVCLQAMSLDPKDRYPSPRALAEDIERWLADEAVSVYQEPVRDRVWRWARKHKAGVGAMTAVIITVLLSIGPIGVVVGVTTQAKKQRLTLTGTIERELEREDWSEAHVQTLEALLSDLRHLSVDDAAAAEDRLYHAFAGSVRNQLVKERFSKSDAERIIGEINRVLTDRPQIAAELRAEVSQRQSAPEVFALASNNTETFFEPASVQLQGESFYLRRASPRGRVSLVPTRFACPGQAHLDAEFSGDWWRSGAGPALHLNFSHGYLALKGYMFRARLADAAYERAPSLVTVNLEIWRNSVLMRQHKFAVPKAARLHISADRDGDRLSLQINDSAPLEVYDVFPLGSSDNGVFALSWPDALPLERLVIKRQFASPKPSSLEQAEDLYERGRYAEAQAYLEAQPRRMERSALGQEIRCKEALCLIGRNRIDEATSRLEQIAAEDGERWPIVALCQLWLVRLKQQKFDEANAIMARLSPHGPDKLRRWLSLSFQRQPRCGFVAGTEVFCRRAVGVDRGLFSDDAHEGLFRERRYPSVCQPTHDGDTGKQHCRVPGFRSEVTASGSASPAALECDCCRLRSARGVATSSWHNGGPHEHAIP